MPMMRIKKTTPQDGTNNIVRTYILYIDIYYNISFNWVQAIIQRYGDKATIFGLDNEPCIWHTTHRDVHPIGATYDELWNMTLQYGTKIKEACNYKCQLLGLSNWGWCGYFTSGYDNQKNINGQGCYTGPDREAHDNLALLPWYLQQNAMYETQNGKRLLDILDVHYYPQNMNSGTGITFNCNEDTATMEYRLQSPRALYDWNYVDPTWINQPIALIPRLQSWINQYYPNTGISISEYNFGGDTCLSSIMAHAEVLSIFSTYNVTLGTRWSKPEPNTFFDNVFELYLNYDGNGASILSNNNGKTYAIQTNTNVIEMGTAYSFVKSENNINTLFVYMFNKNSTSITMNVNMGNNGIFNTNNDINLYGIDGPNNGETLRFIGKVNDKPTSTQFNVNMPKYTIRVAVIKG